MNRTLTLAALLFAGSLLTGCATPSKDAPAKSPAAAAAPGKRDGVSTAISLLYNGDAAQARRVLQRAIKVQPDDKRARSLLQQIDTPPETLLGQEAFAYRARQDDTLSLLAQRFLGDPALFYALARYNNLTMPGVLTPGQVLKIPGKEPPRAAPEPRAAPVPRPADTRLAPKPPAGPNARLAAQLRASGLEQLNRGAIDQAVSLLQQALQNDPANALIKHDLDRAVRISRAVHAKP